MDLNKKRFLSFYLILILLIFLIFIFYFFINKIQKEKIIAQEPISINLLTSVHPKLDWNFKATKKKISM